MFTLSFCRFLIAKKLDKVISLEPQALVNLRLRIKAAEAKITREGRVLPTDEELPELIGMVLYFEHKIKIVIQEALLIVAPFHTLFVFFESAYVSGCVFLRSQEH